MSNISEEQENGKDELTSSPSDSQHTPESIEPETTSANTILVDWDGPEDPQNPLKYESHLELNYE